MRALAQTRRMSMAESVTNVGIGWGINLLGQMVIFPLFGIHVSLGVNLSISASFTGVSVARSYIVRRLFERLRPMESIT